jgi:hypothetical protein
MWASSDRLALSRNELSRNGLGPDEPGQRELRASDAEREQAIGKLRDRFAEGRLSQETFLYRMDAALKAKFPSELSGLFTDLPREEPPRPSTSQRFRNWLGRLWPEPAHPGRPVALALATPAMSEVAPVPVAPPVRMAAPMPLYLPRQEDRRFSIGRAPSCDFTVADISVSRWHARLHKQDENWLLSDLGSTNGTRLNGWRVTSAVPIRPGDHLMFGNVAFVITDNPAPAT